MCSKRVWNVRKKLKKKNLSKNNEKSCERNVYPAYPKIRDSRTAPIGARGKVRPFWFSCLKLIPDTDPSAWQSFHLTIWHKIQENKKFRKLFIGATTRRLRERALGTAWSSSCERRIQIVPRLAGDCGLNGTREFTWGPSRGWVILRRCRLVGRRRSCGWR